MQMESIHRYIESVYSVVTTWPHDMASTMKRVELVVVGAGVIGLSTAVVLAEALPLCRVTVVADRFSPDTTSDGAAGILFMAQFPGTFVGVGWAVTRPQAIEKLVSSVPNSLQRFT